MRNRRGLDFDRAFVLVWLMMVVATLAFWGVVVWAIIELVLWATSK